MKKTISLLFSLLFLLLCLIPGAGMRLFGEAKAGANEVLASAPSLRTRSGGVNWQILSDFSAYLRDRFFPRQQCITAWNTLQAKLLASSASDEVILGRDGWLYYAETIPDYTRSEPMTERELWCAARTVALMQEQVQARGCDFLFLLCPNKNSLYDAHMPPFVRFREESDAARLYALLEGMGVNALDLFPVFARQEEELYYATDSHWNGKGAALGADAILAALGRSGGWWEAGFAPGEAHRGDLYEMLYPAGTATEADFASLRPFTFTYTRAIRGATDITIETECAGAEGALLMFRDSFGNNLYPYLAERFGHAVFSRQTTYDLGLLDRYGADAVAVELVERNIDYLLRYAPVFPAPARRVEITDAEPLAEAAQWSVSGSAPEGCVSVTGALPGTADDDSPVYLLIQGELWEATPRPAGFAACLPETAELSALQAVYYQGGQPVMTAPSSADESLS